MRKLKFQTGSFYHIYNRGVDKRDIFIDNKDYIRFIRSMREFNITKAIDSLYRLDYSRKKDKAKDKEAKLPIGSLASPSVDISIGNLASNPVDIICYCLIYNHFHFILKQLVDNGIEKFMHKLSTGYTKYFNYKHNRSGSLFQGTYKAIQVKTDNYLTYLSGYINGNPEIHKITKAEKWPWSSYRDYLELRSGTLSNKNIILKNFNSVDDYRNYVNIIIKESGQRKDEIKNYLLE